MPGRPSKSGEPAQPALPDQDNAAAVDAVLQDETPARPADPPPPDEPDTAAPPAELQEVQERVLRLQAELENLRKRTAREIAGQRRFGSLPLIRDLLPVLDNIQRAIEAAEKTPDATGLLDGFKMVDQQLKVVLAQHHCTEIDALNQPFNPHLHEAIRQQPAEDQPPGTVLAVTQVGYQLHDRVVRPAQVIVSAPPSPVDSGAT